MPELPEVETTLRGIEPFILGQKVTKVIVRHPSLRWPIPNNLSKLILDQRVMGVTRRAKYLLLAFSAGDVIIHLGMSGKLRVLCHDDVAKKHDHVDIMFENGKLLRLTDPRRFGALLWQKKGETHPLLRDIGIEPLTKSFNGEYLQQKSFKKKASVKAFLMDGKMVAGVGNIYATEALFAAGIHPERPANDVTLAEFQLLAKATKEILQQAIKKGGTTLKDFTKSDGTPGYFSIELKVYGRSGQPCHNCKEPLKLIKIAQRSSVYCSKCQK